MNQSFLVHQATIDPRRPGIERIVEKLLREHPKWSLSKILMTAKVQWHKENDK